MKLSELIAEVGDDNVGLQILDECLSNLTYSEKKGNKFTFVTDQPFDANGTEKMGLVPWIDRDKMAEAFNHMKVEE